MFVNERNSDVADIDYDALFERMGPRFEASFIHAAQELFAYDCSISDGGLKADDWEALEDIMQVMYFQKVATVLRSFQGEMKQQWNKMI